MDALVPTHTVKTIRARSFLIGLFFQVGIFDWCKMLRRHVSSPGIATLLFGKEILYLENWSWMIKSVLFFRKLDRNVLFGATTPPSIPDTQTYNHTSIEY